ncbi:MAG: restriction endonuclease subunit S [Bacteroidales bacterium]|nr:restriction endonuclease subunit S [Bacteroidales bacterium]
MTTETTYAPELRFPEFHDDWQVKPLSFFLHEHKLKSGGTEQVYSVSVVKGVVNQIEHLGRSFAASDTSKYKLVKPYDIVYTKSPTGDFPYGIIKQSKNDKNVIVSPLYGVFSPNNKYIGYIIDCYFESPIRTNSYLGNIVQKGAKNTIQITNDTFLSKNVLFPTNEEEQRKIALCLSSLDNLIKAVGEKIDLLKQHKKGLMQKLFPRLPQGRDAINRVSTNQNVVPELRFPDFSGDWEVKNGNDLFNTIVNKNHNSDLPILAITQEQGAVPREMIDYNISVTDASVASYKVVEIGDFIISLRSFQGGIEYSNYNGICSPAYIILRKKSDDVCDDFYKYYFKTKRYISELTKNLEGIRDGKMISYKQFSETKLPYPSLAEQRKIADCLSSIDKAIEETENKVRLLEQHKKGLMQKMFVKM